MSPAIWIKSVGPTAVRIDSPPDFPCSIIASASTREAGPEATLGISSDPRCRSLASPPPPPRTAPSATCGVAFVPPALYLLPMHCRCALLAPSPLTECFRCASPGPPPSPPPLPDCSCLSPCRQAFTFLPLRRLRRLVTVSQFYCPPPPLIFCPCPPSKTCCLRWRMRRWHCCLCPLMASWSCPTIVVPATLLLVCRIFSYPPFPLSAHSPSVLCAACGARQCKEFACGVCAAVL